MMSAVWSRAAKATGVLLAAVCVTVPTGVVTAAGSVAQPPDSSGPAAGGDAAEAKPGEYVVMLRSGGAGVAAQGVSGADLSSRITTVMSRLKQTVRGESGSSASPGIAAAAQESVLAELPVVDGFGAKLTAGEAAMLATFDDVLSVEPNIRVKASEVPELPWGLDRIDQPKLPLDDTYSPDGDGAGVTAYVIDNGVWGEHEEFGGRAAPLVDFVGDFSDPADVEPYCMDHGTHVAATVAGTNVGVAPAAKVQGVRVLGCDGYGWLIDVLRGMDWVAHNATLPAVVNMSLGGLRTSSEDTAVRYLTSKGISVVVAAGNESYDACLFSPAWAPTAITVGATNVDDEGAWFSNYGPCVDVYAPGEDVVSASVEAPDAYVSFSGTSMASPHVAGIAAVYLSQHPTAQPSAVEKAIVDGASADVITKIKPSSPNLLAQVNDLPAPVNTPATDPVAYIKTPPGNGIVQVGTTFTFDGTDSFDPNGGALTYEWRIEGKPGVVGTGSTLEAVVDEVGLFEVALKVTNPAGVSSTAYLMMEADDLNPPVLVLDPEPETVLAQPGDELSWDASASYDPDGGELTYEWYYETESGLVEESGPTFSTTFAGDYGFLIVAVVNEYDAYAAAGILVVEPLNPVAVVSPAKPSVTVGDTVTFSAAESTPADSIYYEWRDSEDGEVVSYEDLYQRKFTKAGTYSVYLTVTAYTGEISTAEAVVTVSEVAPPPLEPTAMFAVAPMRVMDTRLLSKDVPGPKGALTAGGVAQFTMPDLPDGIAGAVLNVTAVNPSSNGHLTVYPCGERPDTSNVNYRAGVTTANAVVTLLGGQQDLCVWSYAGTDVVVDVTGYVPDGTRAPELEAVRAIDTRSQLGTSSGRLPAGGIVKVPVSKVAKVPANASAVFVNLTAANPAANGHLTAYPCGQVPDTSNVNYRAGATKANMAVVKLAKDGMLCVKSFAETDVVVDVLGYAATGDVQLGQKRELDTRASELSTSPDQKGKVAAGAMVKVKLDVDPAKVDGVFLNVAAVNPDGDGHVTVFPCGKQPTASNLNYRAGVTTSNMVFSKVDMTGSVCVSTFAATDLIVDYNGSVKKPT